jgi:hypothetical protein
MITVLGQRQLHPAQYRLMGQLRPRYGERESACVRLDLPDARIRRRQQLEFVVPAGRSQWHGTR